MMKRFNVPEPVKIGEVEYKIVLHVWKRGTLITRVWAEDADTQEPIGCISVTPTKEMQLALDDYEFIVKNYTENAVWAEEVLRQLPQLFAKTDKFVPCGFCVAPIYSYKTGG